MFKKVAILVTIAILSFSLSLTVLAMRPVIVESENLEDITYPAYFCDDFVILSNVDVKYWVTRFYDKDGELVRETAHQQIKNPVFFNSENPEIMFEAGADTQFAETRFENGLAVEWRWRGITWHIQDRGEKLMFISGQMNDSAEDGWSTHGLFFYPLDEEAHAKLCAYFAD